MSDTDKIKYIIKRLNVSPDYLAEVREVFTQRKFYNPIIYKNNSRYKNLRTLFDEQRKVTVHENWNKKVIPESSKDSYFTVDLVSENRLDIISSSYYDSPRYWWVIALANNIIDPFDVPMGITLRIPPLSAISGGDTVV